MLNIYCKRIIVWEDMWYVIYGRYLTFHPLVNWEWEREYPPNCVIN